MKYYIISGEASGDLHGSMLIKALQRLDKEADIRCWGGDMMEATGATLVKHYRDLAFMGFVEVLQNIRTIMRNIAFCKKDIAAYHPDVLVLVDYPGFNLRIAKWASLQNFKVIYYISPQVWAWKESRVHDIKKYVDRMLVILPFEKDFYHKWQYDVDYVGHPLVDVIEHFEKDKQDNQQHILASLPAADPDKIIALLPGSRRQEILKKLPLMLEAASHFPGYTCVVAKAPGLPSSFYDDIMQPYSNVGAVVNQTYALLSASKAALVTSGTATLETALFGVPQVVCYIGSNISYQIARRLIKIKYISLVNLIMDKPVVKELIQKDCTPENMRQALTPLLKDGPERTAMLHDYNNLKEILKSGGAASSNAAAIVYQAAITSSGND